MMVSMEDAQQGIRKEFGKILRRQRVAAGLSQETLALRCGLDRTYISMLERGLKTPTLYTVFLLSAELGVKASDQIREMETSYPTSLG